MNIYLDMDDVVADWLGHVKELLNEPNWVMGQMLPDETWKRLKVEHQRLYSVLPLKEGATDLVAWVTEYSKDNDCGLFFLSAIPHLNDVPWAPSDKVFWGQKYFPHIPVFLGPYSHEKYMRCKPGDILIDDRISNCEEWERAGGRAHIYRSWPECKAWLEATLLEKDGTQKHNQ